MINSTDAVGWEDLPLTTEHAKYLEAHAISPAAAKNAAVYSVTSADQLPDEFAWCADQETAVPGIVFTWVEPTGDVKLQYRPDAPVETADGPAKYLFRKGHAAQLGVVAEADGDLVLIVEGTKQMLVAGQFAPEGASVYGIAGCSNWQSDGVPTPDLAVCDDRDVVIILDADAATKLPVYEAGMKLREAVEAEGARSVKFARVTGGKNSGLDDVLAGRPAERRAAYLARMIEKAKTKPADVKPKPAPRGGSSQPEIQASFDRPMIFVDGDRYAVINQITRALTDRWNGHRLFSHGQVISQLGVDDRGQPAMEVVEEGPFFDLLQETAMIVRQGPGDRPAFGWPDTQTVKAVMSRDSAFARLERVARIPFVREDGSICQVNGYDMASATMVVMNDELASISVPSDPTPEDVSSARKFILDEWLGDFPFHTEADRANVLALVLTPFVRNLMPIVPLAVVDGLQMGVGKNLLVEQIYYLLTGVSLDPIGWNDSDEEVRKIITSAFRSGSDVFAFDEAHHLHGAALARALTSAHYKDRQLSTNQLLGFPNNVTWISMGNAVRIEGDIVRRVYRIALKPTAPDPQDRPSTSFRHPDLRAWTVEHRAELLTAALILIRSWFAKGSPDPTKPVSFGSFEKWERILGGIIENAGQAEFLGGMKKWRSETSFDMQHWSAHISWLHRKFGGKPFTTAQARAAMVQDQHSETPPGMTKLDGDARDYNRELGKAYAGKRDRFFEGGLKLTKCERGPNHTGLWVVLGPDDPIQPDVTPAPDPEPQEPTPAPKPATVKERTPAKAEPPAPAAPAVTDEIVWGDGLFPAPVVVDTQPTVVVADLPDHGPVTAPRTFSEISTSPIEHLLPLADRLDERICPGCGEDEQLVPPGNFWFSCSNCHPATFTRN